MVTVRCLRFVFLLVTRLVEWSWLCRREESWKDAEILLLRRQLAVLRRQPVGFQNSATRLGLVFYAARSYSLMRPPAGPWTPGTASAGGTGSSAGSRAGPAGMRWRCPRWATRDQRL
jgi:hypothetical protein